MNQQATGKQQDPQQPFAWVNRFFTPLARFADWLEHRATYTLDFIYWLFTLASIVPAMRTDSLFPYHWGQGVAADYTIKWFDKTFSLLGLEGFETIQLISIASVIILMMLLLFVLAVSKRSYARLLAILPWFLILLPYFTLKLEFFRAEPIWFAITNTLYSSSAFAVFLYFIVAARIRSLYFVVFVLLLALWQFVDTLLGWKQVISFIMASMVLSFIYETVRQNWPLLSQIGRSGALGLLLRSFSLWSPTLILIATGLWISYLLTTGTELMLYEQDVVTPHCVFSEARPAAIIRCPGKKLELFRSTIYTDRSDALPAKCYVHDPEQAKRKYKSPRLMFGCPANLNDPHPEIDTYTYSLSRAPFIVSLENTINAKFDKAIAKLIDAERSFKQARFQDPLWVEQEARRMFSFVPRNTGLVQTYCKAFDVDCGIANLVKRILNRAYADIRRRAEQRFVANAVERAESGKAEGMNAINTARKEIETELEDLKEHTSNTINSVYQMSKVLQILFTAWMIIIAIKSFLYVFSRVIFDKSTDIHVDLLEQDSDAKQGSVKHLQEINIPGNYPHSIYYKSNFQPLGPAPRFSIPQWSSSLLSRLCYGAWSMNRVDMPVDDPHGITFNAIEAEYLVDWQLEEGEEVIFSYKNLVAMNDNIELRTVISLRVATMLMGRFIFHTARCKAGPGRLILRTRGKPATAEQVRQSIPASRLIAWNRYARFSVDSHLTRADIFLNGFNLRRSETDEDGKPQGIIIVEADARSGSIMTGTLRFAKNFLLPV